MTYVPAADRYAQMVYRRCGASGLKLPAISLGLWHNFGGDTPHEVKRAICRTAFDLGITHFDLANNYGPPIGSAETAFGEILRTDFNGFRDELVISSKAGWGMWQGPYGDWGSRKYLIASCDQSLKRMGLDYVDIFYHHRPDPDTPLEETMGALDHIVRSGRALYVGISSYKSEQTREAVAILKDLGTPCLIHQPSYSMINRWVERDGLKDTLAELGVGSIAFSPLAQGMLTGKYLNGIPDGSPRDPGQEPEPRPGERSGGEKCKRTQQDRQSAWADAGADGAGLGAARRRHHHGADRRLAARAGRRLRRRRRQPDLLGRRTGRDRQICRWRRGDIVGGEGRHDDPKPDPSRLPCRPVVLPGGRRLVHRHLDLRMVSGRADPSFNRSGELAAGGSSAGPGGAAGHARQSRQLRRLGAVPQPRRRPVLAGLHRRQAAGWRLQGRPQLHHHLRHHRRHLVRSVVREFLGLRPVAVPRRRRPQVFHEPAVESPWARHRRQPEARQLRRHPAAGMVAGSGPCGSGPEHLSGHRPRPDRGAAHLPAQWLVLPDDGRGWHRLWPRRHAGAGARHLGAVRKPPRQARHHHRPCRKPPDPAHRAWPVRRGAGRAGLAHVPDGPADAGAGRVEWAVLPAGPRDRDRARGLARRLDVSRGRRATAARRTARPDRRRSAAGAPVLHRLRPRRAAARVPVAAHPRRPIASSASTTARWC